MDLVYVDSVWHATKQNDYSHDAMILKAWVIHVPHYDNLAVTILPDTSLVVEVLD